MAATCKKHCTTSDPAKKSDATTTLFIAFELAAGQWKLAFTVGAGQQARLRTIRARDLIAVEREVELAIKRFRLPRDARVVSCYEAGRDGFWLHRFLHARGIENFIVDSASSEVNRRRRQAKTDRLDATKLVAMLVRFVAGERRVWSVVRVPSDSDEDGRQMHRELEQLKDERTTHVNRIKGLLASQGLCIEVADDFPEQLSQLRRWNDTAVPKELQARLQREFERLQFLRQQILELEKERRRRLQRDDEPHVGMIRDLLELRGIGVNGAWLLVREIFSWREIQNRREVGSLAGMTPTPFGSGDMDHEQGISKAGNRRLRRMMV